MAQVRLGVDGRAAEVDPGTAGDDRLERAPCGGSACRGARAASGHLAGGRARARPGRAWRVRGSGVGRALGPRSDQGGVRPRRTSPARTPRRYEGGRARHAARYHASIGAAAVRERGVRRVPWGMAHRTLARRAEHEESSRDRASRDRRAPRRGRRGRRLVASAACGPPDAGHVAWADALGRWRDVGRTTANPAGRPADPMLEVLEKRDLDRVVAAVARRFGGVKLGAGGLVRAYGGAAREGGRRGRRRLRPRSRRLPRRARPSPRSTAAARAQAARTSSSPHRLRRRRRGPHGAPSSGGHGAARGTRRDLTRGRACGRGPDRGLTSAQRARAAASGSSCG